jgi:hypothetical protein
MFIHLLPSCHHPSKFVTNPSPVSDHSFTDHFQTAWLLTPPSNALYPWNLSD